MEVKKYLGVLLTIVGGAGLVVGVLGLFNEIGYLGINPWALTILGVFFFFSGITLLRSIRRKDLD